MSNLISEKAGLPPGTLIHIGDKKTDLSHIAVIDYGIDSFTKKLDFQVADCSQFLNKFSKSWINVDGLNQVEVISQIGDVFGLHPLLLEEVLNTRHRPKFEEFDEHLFVVLKMIGINSDNSSIVIEQLSLVLGDSWIISFQEQEGDIFDGLRERMEVNK